MARCNNAIYPIHWGFALWSFCHVFLWDPTNSLTHSPPDRLPNTVTLKDIGKSVCYKPHHRENRWGKHQISGLLYTCMYSICMGLFRFYIYIYTIHVPGWLQKWLNLITAPGSVSNEPGSVTWLATKYLKTVSWRNHTDKLTTLWPQNISFWPKINIPSSYFTILMLNCLENTLKLKFDSYVTAVKFLT